MGGDLPTVLLGDLLSEDRGISVGVMYPGDHDPLGIPLIKAGDLVGSRISPSPEFRISPSVHQQYRRTELSGGELLMTLVGDVGRCAVVPTSMKGWNAARAVAVMRFKNKQDAAFVRLCLQSPEVRHLLDAWSNTTVQQTLNLKEIKVLPLPWPPEPERDAIAHILGTLDDKIELNRRMNETLEEMARALFKSWFVDFDPVRRKAEGRDPGLPKHLADLFPSRFVDSELGEIPEGWRVGQWRDTVTLVKDSRNPGDEPATTFHHFSIPAYDEGQEPKRETGADIKSLKFVVGPGDVLLSKLNPAIERVWHIDLSPGAPAVCSTEFLVLRPRVPFHRTYVYCAARSAPFRTELRGLVTGTSNSHQRVQPESMLDLATVLPLPSVLASFESVATPILDRIHSARRETRALASTRDALLPKLISGELHLKDADRFLAKGTA